MKSPRRLFAAVLSAAIAAEIFSGNWSYAGLPPLDRVLFAATVAVLCWYGAKGVLSGRLRLRPVHALLLATAAYAIVSAMAAGTWSSSRARFALLDRLGILPFVLFAIAPLVFGRRRNRELFQAVLVGVGGYLGLVAVLDGLGLRALVVPAFIENPSVGILYGRARGPFLEPGANGLAMFMCGAAAAIGLATWTSRRARVTCQVVLVLCVAGTVFTLTRAVWVAAVAGAAVGLVWLPSTRSLLAPLAAVTAVAVLLLLTLVPSLDAQISSRVHDQQSVWDRLNTNRAAVSMLEARPLFGFGWQTFRERGPDYLWQAGDYPMTGAGLEVHNVFLSHAAELGLIGSALWVVTLLAAVGGAIVRRGPPELTLWRAGLAAIFVAFLVCANLSPVSAAFPNLILWTWAGIVARDHFLEQRVGVSTRPARRLVSAPLVPAGEPR